MSQPVSTPATETLAVRPIPYRAAALLLKHHYLHSLPGGTKLALGVFQGDRLLGALTFGAGPANVHRLVEGASAREALTLSRLWLADDLPRCSESRVIGQTLRALRHSSVKFLVSYADPAAGHVGTIYQATNWLYTGLSEPTPHYLLAGKKFHSRTLSHRLGTHSVQYFTRLGMDVRPVVEPAKHRYVFFLDRRWRSRLLVPVLPYPKREQRA